MYVAVDLDTAPESALKKHEGELHEMEARKRELQELAKQQRFRPSDGVATFKIVKSIKDVLGAALPVFLSRKESFWVVNREGVKFSAAFGILEAEREFIESGGQCCGISDVTYRIIDVIRYHLDIGADVRHIGDYREKILILLELLFHCRDTRFCFLLRSN